MVGQRAAYARVMDAPTLLDQLDRSPDQADRSDCDDDRPNGHHDRSPVSPDRPEPDADRSPTVTLDQATVLLGISREAVRSRLRRGQLAGIQTATGWLVYLTGHDHGATGQPTTLTDQVTGHAEPPTGQTATVTGPDQPLTSFDRPATAPRPPAAPDPRDEEIGRLRVDLARTEAERDAARELVAIGERERVELREDLNARQREVQALLTLVAASQGLALTAGAAPAAGADGEQPQQAEEPPPAHVPGGPPPGRTRRHWWAFWAWGDS